MVVPYRVRANFSSPFSAPGYPNLAIRTGLPQGK